MKKTKTDWDAAIRSGDIDAIYRSVGISEADIARYREADDHRKLAYQLIDEGYRRLIARRPEHAARLERMRPLLYREVKRMKFN